MTCIPILPSFGFIPRNNQIEKIIEAHDFLLKNPEIKKKVIKRGKIRINKKHSFKVWVKTNSMDINELLDILFKWDLTDILDVHYQEDLIEIKFRTPTSAYNIRKLSEVNLIKSEFINLNSRVPLVFLQGFPIEITNEQIKSFFNNLTPILKIKRIIKNDFFGIILKLPTIQKAIKLSELSNKEKFNNFILSVSYQFKSSITKCFYIYSLEIEIPIDEILNEILNFGPILEFFSNFIGSTTALFIKMESLKDSKITCGFLNNKLINGYLISTVFIDNDYFDNLKPL